MESQCDLPSVVPIFHRKDAMMESVEVAVRKRKIWGRCEMCIKGVFFSYVILL